jgi:hypothetical protein
MRAWSLSDPTRLVDRSCHWRYAQHAGHFVRMALHAEAGTAIPVSSFASPRTLADDQEFGAALAAERVAPIGEINEAAAALTGASEEPLSSGQQQPQHGLRSAAAVRATFLRRSHEAGKAARARHRARRQAILKRIRAIAVSLSEEAKWEREVFGVHLSSLPDASAVSVNHVIFLISVWHSCKENAVSTTHKKDASDERET